MNPVLTSGSTGALTESQRAALLNLLTDDDPAVYQVIRSKILSQGPSVKDWLKSHTLSADPVLRRRAREIIEFLDRQASDNRFLAFCLSRGEDLDMEQGAWLLAQTQYPGINIGAYQALLDSFSYDLKDRISYSDEPERILSTINHYLFEEQKFSGNEQDYYAPENSYLNCVVDQRTGNSHSLCAIYLSMSRRLRLPIAGIGMPGYFLCRYQGTTGEIYIDAFRKGKFLTKGDCVKMLANAGQESHDGFLAPVSPRRILLRMCANLHHIYTSHEMAEETARMQRYIIALSK